MKTTEVFILVGVLIHVNNLRTVPEGNLSFFCVGKKKEERKKFLRNFYPQLTVFTSYKFSSRSASSSRKLKFFLLLDNFCFFLFHFPSQKTKNKTTIFSSILFTKKTFPVLPFKGTGQRTN